MKFDFDKITDRRGTYSLKYDPAARGMPEDVLPMWVADMDIKVPPCVVEALQKHVAHGIFGYSEPDSAYFETVKAWYKRRFAWTVEKDSFILIPGVVTAIHQAILALTEPGDGILVQQPVYPYFTMAAEITKRKPLINELVYENGKYSIDFDDFKKKAKDAKLFILCSPHNPGGRVWTLEELTKIGEICLQNGITVIADEIHQDFIFPNHKHSVFANIDRELSEITVTCTSPSKTFNLAGLPLSNILISNSNLRRKFTHQNAVSGFGHPGVLSLAACKAAYEGGEEWLEELLIYLKGNMVLVDEFLKEKLPKITLVEPESTYLAWLDCKKLGLPENKLVEIITHEAKLWLDKGTKFGPPGEGFQRVNVACPRSVVKQGLTRLEAALRSI